MIEREKLFFKEKGITLKNGIKAIRRTYAQKQVNEDEMDVFTVHFIYIVDGFVVNKIVLENPPFAKESDLRYMCSMIENNDKYWKYESEW